MAKGVREPAAQANDRRAEAGTGTRAEQATIPIPIPCCSRAPCWLCRTGVLGDGAGSGSSTSRALGAATVRPCDQGKGETTRRRWQSEGSALRARPREPNRPLPERAISRPQPSRRLSQASAGPAGTLPLAALGTPTPPAPHTRPESAHGRLTLCHRRSCCRPDRRRYRSPPFAVSAPKGTRVSEEGPRNITPLALPPGLSEAPPDRKSHARTRARAHVRRAAPSLGDGTL